MPYSIVTGNGFTTNAQRAEDNNDFCAYPGFGSTTYLPNGLYNITFKYRCNVSINICRDYSPALGPISANPSTALLYSISGLTLSYASTSIGFQTNLAVLNSTSSSSITTPTANPTIINFTMGTGLQYASGFSIRMTRTGFGSPTIIGTITSYTSGTGACTISSTSFIGTGTYSAWTIVYEHVGAWLEIDEVNVYAV